MADTEQTKYERLKEQIIRWSCDERISGAALASDRFDEIMPRIRESAAHRLGMALLENDMLEFNELKPVDTDDYDQLCGDQVFRTHCWIVRPGAVDAHKKELQKAREEGYDQAIREIEDEAAQLKKLDCYGPVIGNAMQATARLMRYNQCLTSN